jgi:hypothetical protein
LILWNRLLLWDQDFLLYPLNLSVRKPPLFLSLLLNLSDRIGRLHPLNLSVQILRLLLLLRLNLSDR